MTVTATLNTYRVTTHRPGRRGLAGTPSTVTVRAESARAARIMAESNYRALFSAPASVFVVSDVVSL